MVATDASLTVKGMFTEVQPRQLIMGFVGEVEEIGEVLMHGYHIRLRALAHYGN